MFGELKILVISLIKFLCCIIIVCVYDATVAW